MASIKPRLAVRGIILIENRLLLVNAWPGAASDLWCAPGGGVEVGSSLPDNLIREVHEETGLTVAVGAPCLVNEFHDPARRFHQVDIYFRCTVQEGALSQDWTDPEGIVNRYRLATRAGLGQLRVKPDSLGDVAWCAENAPLYDPLEPILR
ncbi:MAG: NUDIX hydrolase [Pseudomonadota bacterium]